MLEQVLIITFGALVTILFFRVMSVKLLRWVEKELKKVR